jgi:hypothetical protein
MSDQAQATTNNNGRPVKKEHLLPNTGRPRRQFSGGIEDICDQAKSVLAKDQAFLFNIVSFAGDSDFGGICKIHFFIKIPFL